MRSSFLRRLLPGALLMLSVAALRPLSAQDNASRGVRIGLTYDPGSKPGVVVLPVTGSAGDSVRAIVQRDFDFGDRINPIVLDAATASEASRGSGPNWPLLAKLGAAAAVQITPTASGFHLAVFNVATKQTALIRDYATSAAPQSRAWRAALHGIADDLEEAFTGVRGIARTRVLFERGKRIWVVDSDGENVMPVSDVGTPLSPSWDPSGRTITYSTIVPAGISVLDLSSGRARTLVSGPGVFISPVFSPDGSSVVYAHGVDAGVDLFTVPLSGGGGRRLSVGRGSDNVSPSFSPDGRRIVFMSGRAGHPEIYTMDADGTNVDLLTPLDIGENAYRASPDWSPDGRLVAFQSQIGGTFQVLTINLRDRSLRQLTSDGRNEDPSWAPDGRHLTFVSNRSGVRQLWVLDIETGRSRQLTRGAPVRVPAWSPRLAAE
ncbi:MAG: PD40 domain-containing protein [Gemmatimonadetes bacterium]|nr:PD40 domain-containing protein [Gemmatimonadota bacterium]